MAETLSIPYNHAKRGALCLKMLEPFLSEIPERNQTKEAPPTLKLWRAGSPPLRALLATPQKNTLCSFHFARAGLVVSLSNPFFLLRLRRCFGGQVKGKEIFLLGSALNEQGGGLGLYFLQEHGGIPPTPPFRRALARTDGIFGGD